MDANTNAAKPSFHGSDVEKVEKLYGIPAKDIAAFGSNVNPFGISPLMRERLKEQIDVVSAYPDRDYTALRQAVASYTGVKASQVLPGNGSTELISLAMQITKPKKACIIDPTYSEYSREIAIGGGVSFYYTLREENAFALSLPDLGQVLTEDVDLLVFCNPNNPTGTALTLPELKKIMALCRERHILVVIDETYAEFAHDTAAVSAVSLIGEYDNLLILRGTSKFFAAPGLRLGYALCSNETLLAQIKAMQNPWSVNSLAAKAGEIMFSDHAYIEKTRRFIAEEQERIYERLKAVPGLKPYRPAANFILVKIEEKEKTAADFFEFAILRGLMIRDCSDFDGLGDRFFRFCFLDRETNDRLLTCIETFF